VFCYIRITRAKKITEPKTWIFMPHLGYFFFFICSEDMWRKITSVAVHIGLLQHVQRTANFFWWLRWIFSFLGGPSVLCMYVWLKSFSLSV
jgi:hypothetical protein